MHFRPGFIVGFGLGYLLGARAGREHYDAIMRQVREVRERPEVQSAAGVVSAQAGSLLEKARRTFASVAGRGEPSSPTTGTFVGTVGAHSPNGSGAIRTP
ncbi:YtxH domain-containing protein [Candidatus Protofrankia californiensis]|uniref:YtxH domain-containing protein n=1 Tax=Candidatus Protofrankia californiensis TaxID=1839754 RepID=UPI00104153A4|nr:YtxH domain-containing protein [Candidatus Protofrankia californiensis]